MAAYNFLGQHLHTLDSKKRVAIPAKYRQQLPEGQVYVTTLPEGCLAVYPQSEWDDLVHESIGRLDPLPPEARRIRRGLSSHAEPCTPDKQGRITITTNQLEQTGIDKEVVFAGSINYFEIWSKDRWEIEESLAGAQLQPGG
ncbi:MAG: division/cell wall cluster transcriptional repressor MraZ [Thermoleophilia bacterium]